MSKDYAVHWIIVAIATCVWFWGDLLHIPVAGINLAATMVPAAIAHALAFGQPSQVSPVTPAAPQVAATTFSNYNKE